MPRKSVTNKTVVTEVSVTSKNIPRKSLHYEYVEDEWEKTPKTGYTYAQSGSYSKNYLNEGYVSPNMARNRLRHGLGIERSNIVQETSMLASSSAQSAQYESSALQQEESSTTVNTAAHGETSYSATLEEEESNYNNSASEAAAIEERLQQLALRRKLSKEEIEELERVRNVRGVLRSGTRYGPMWRTVGGHTHRRSGRHSVGAHTDLSTSHISQSHASRLTTEEVNSQETHEEFSSREEERILHSPLYGLDNMDGDMEVSDTEADHQSRSQTISSATSYSSSSESESSTSFWERITFFMSSIFSSSAGLIFWIFSSLFSGAQSAASYAGQQTRGLGSSLYTYVVDHVQNESWVLLKTTTAIQRDSQSSSSISASGSSSAAAAAIAEKEKKRRRGFCCCLPIPCCCLLFLLPLLLAGRELVKDRHDNSTSILAGIPLFGYLSNRESFYIFGGSSKGDQGAYVGSQTAGQSGNSAAQQQAGMAGMYISEQDLEEKIRAIVMAIYRDGEKNSEVKNQEFHQNILVQQQDNLNQHKSDLETTVKNMLLNEMDTMNTKMTDRENTVLAAVKEEAGAAAKSQAILAVAASVEKIQQQIETGDAVKVGEEERQAALTGIASRIDGLEAKLVGLGTSQDIQTSGIAELNSQLLAAVAKTEAVQQELLQAKTAFAAGDAAIKADNALLIEQLQAQLNNLNTDLSGLKAAYTELAATAKTCCKNDSDLIALIKAQVKEHVNSMFGGVAGASGGGSDSDDGAGMAAGGFFGGSGSSADSGTDGSNTGFAMWLQNQLNSKDSALDSKIAALAADMAGKMAAMKEETGQTVAAALAASSEKEPNCTVCNTTETIIVQQAPCNDSGAAGAFAAAGAAGFSGLSEEQIKVLIADALAIYGADKTGMVDYALESGGGSVISTRCSETYHRKTAQLSLLGIPLWYISNSPRTAIQPDVNIGQCWAFKGSMGFLVVQLAGTVYPTAFTLEHITKAMSPTGRIDSAPRDFTVFGLQYEQDNDAVNLGNYTYSEDGPSLQTFNVQAVNPGSFPIIELKILNNWGSIEYTCLYRFRVHGNLAGWNNGK